MMKLVKTLTVAVLSTLLSSIVFSHTAYASNQGGSAENITTSAETGLVGSTQVASAVVSIPVVVVSGGVVAVGSVAHETIDWALGADNKPLPLTDKTLIADKDPAAAMGGHNGE